MASPLSSMQKSEYCCLWRSYVRTLVAILYENCVRCLYIRYWI